jgi:hypothetical protein
MTIMTSSMFPDISLTITKNLKVLTVASFKTWQNEYKMLMPKKKTDLKKNQNMNYEGPGVSPQKAEGDSSDQTRLYEGNIETINQKVYSFEMPVTWEQRHFAYKNYAFMNQLGMYLARSQKLRYEYECANVHNQGFSGGPTGADGEQYYSASHTWKSGGSYSNLLDSVDMGKDALESHLKTIAAKTMERSIPAALRPGMIHIGTSNIFVLPELLKSSLDPETNTNAYNALNEYPLKKNLNHYFSDADSYIIDTDVKTRVLLESQGTKFDSYVDNPTLNLVERAMSSIGAGFERQLGSFASQGG